MNDRPPITIEADTLEQKYYSDIVNSYEIWVNLKNDKIRENEHISFQKINERFNKFKRMSLGGNYSHPAYRGDLNVILDLIYDKKK